MLAVSRYWPDGENCVANTGPFSSNEFKTEAHNLKGKTYLLHALCKVQLAR